MGCGSVKGSSKKYEEKSIEKECTIPGFTLLSVPEIKSGGFDNHHFIASNAAQIDTLYTIEGEIGAGAYGSVRKAIKISSGAERAIKSIPKHCDADNKACLAVRQEVEILSLLDHPNVIKLYETFEDAMFYYLVMELCDGGELLDRLLAAESGFSEKLTATLSKKIAGALHYMHSMNIAHLDLKPQNFLLSDKRKDIGKAPLKIIDFGVSRQFVPGVPMTGATGTLCYAASEVLKGEYTEKCDIWSLGVIIHTFLSGLPPFYGSDAEVTKLIHQGDVKFAAPVWKKVSKHAKDLIKHMITVDAKSRYSAEQVLNHPWIAKHAHLSEEDISEDVMNSLKHFRASCKLKKACLTVMARNLSEQTIEKLKGVFRSLDANGDGTISAHDIHEGLLKANVDVPADLDEILKEMDSDGSGVIDYTEFLAASLESKHYVQEEVCWQAFRVFDLDGSGKLSKNEITQVLSGGQHKEIEAALEADRLEIEKIVSDLDSNGDGCIDFSEFMAMVTAPKQAADCNLGA